MSGSAGAGASRQEFETVANTSGSALCSWGGPGGAPREIVNNDITLPMAFALFDDGRYAEALEWFQKAHKKLPDQDGGDEAALMIGKIYLYGLGDRSDSREAVVWLKRAALAIINTTKFLPQFDPEEPDKTIAICEAAALLGQLYLTGARGISKDPAEAIRWFERAAETGHVPSLKTLGDIYYYGIDTPKNAKKAVSYYGKSARLNYAPAQFALAEILYRGDTGVNQDLKAALAWYNYAAKLDHPGAQYALAIAYDSGEGVKPDPAKAIGFYKLAAVNGEVHAQAAMGTYFYEGKQLPKDDVMARKWFEAAAIQGETDAMFNLAAMLMKGEGGDKDLVKSWVWFRLARTKGHPKAAAALATLERRMSEAEKQAAAEIVKPKTTG